MIGVAAAFDEGALKKIARSQGFTLEKRRRSRWGESPMFRIKVSATGYVGDGGYLDYQLTLDEVRQFLTLPAVSVMQLERIKFEVIKQIREDQEAERRQREERQLRALKASMPRRDGPEFQSLSH